jgi:GNAT superfamily N-acetyltransferase
VQPESIEVAGAYAVFDGPDSPITQCFGFGVFEEAQPEDIQKIEEFFFERKAPVYFEVSPMAGVQAVDLLCSRGYRPVELSSVLYQPVTALSEPSPRPDVWARRIDTKTEAELWARISMEGWLSEIPDLRDFLLEMGTILAARRDSFCFLAGVGDTPGAAGVMSVHEGVALFGGASTIPAMRRQGLQAALLRERMKVASELGCDLAMMVAMAGSGSQRNAERQGFRIAYTRTKWKLEAATR